MILESCKTPNGETAPCISIYDCPLLLKAVKSKDPSKLDFLKESQCGFEKYPLVCCGSDENFAPADRFDNPQTTKGSGTSTKNTALPDRTACGFQVREIVVPYLFWENTVS